MMIIVLHVCASSLRILSSWKLIKLAKNTKTISSRYLDDPIQT